MLIYCDGGNFLFFTDFLHAIEAKQIQPEKSAQLWKIKSSKNSQYGIIKLICYI